MRGMNNTSYSWALTGPACACVPSLQWRIIVVKLADRLHNMRTMGSMPPAKARKIAAETLEVFGPLARLLGLYSIKEELEELAFK